MYLIITEFDELYRAEDITPEMFEESAVGTITIINCSDITLYNDNKKWVSLNDYKIEE